MSKQITFTVSKKNGPSVEVTFAEPEGLSDARWDELVSNKEDINTLALKALRVAIQAGAREELDGGEAAVQAYVNAYKYKAGGTRGARKPKPITKDVQKKGKFSKEQLEILALAGFTVEA